MPLFEDLFLFVASDLKDSVTCSINVESTFICFNIKNHMRDRIKLALLTTLNATSTITNDKLGSDSFPGVFGGWSDGIFYKLRIKPNDKQSNFECLRHWYFAIHTIRNKTDRALCSQECIFDDILLAGASRYLCTEVTRLQKCCGERGLIDPDTQFSSRIYKPLRLETHNNVALFEEIVSFVVSDLVDSVSCSITDKSTHIYFNFDLRTRSKIKTALQFVLNDTSTITRYAGSLFTGSSIGTFDDFFYRLSISPDDKQKNDYCLYRWYKAIRNYGSECRSTRSMCFQETSLTDILYVGTTRYLCLQMKHLRNLCAERGLIDLDGKFSTMVDNYTIKNMFIFENVL